MRPALLLAVIALTLPSAAGASVGGRAPPPDDAGYSGGPLVVPLFGHIYDLLQPVPMNTQRMASKDLARGFGSPSVTGAGPLAGQNFMRFYSSPGLVEYNETEKDGLPRHHPERGISYDVMLDPSKDIIGHWFMGAKALDVPQAGQTSGPEAGAMPGFTVRVTMRVGDEVGTNLDAGAIIAQGTSVLSDPSKSIDRGEAVEFLVNMGKPKVDRIPGNASFNLKVEWFNAESPDGNMQATQRDWILHTGARYPNRVEVTVLNPLALYSVRPTPVGDDTVSIHAELNSPFGNYDVNTTTLELSVEGPSIPTSIGAPLIVQRSYEHNHHYEPVDASWVWKFKDDHAKPGTYKVTVHAKNLQGTASVVKSATFVIPENGRVTGYSDKGDLVQAQGSAPTKSTPLGGLLWLAAAGVIAAGLPRPPRGRR